MMPITMNEFEIQHEFRLGISNENDRNDDRLVVGGSSSSSWSPKKWKKTSRGQTRTRTRKVSTPQAKKTTHDYGSEDLTPTISNKRGDTHAINHNSTHNHNMMMPLQTAPSTNHNKQSPTKPLQRNKQPQEPMVVPMTFQVPPLAPKTQVPRPNPKYGFASLARKVVTRGRRHTLAYIGIPTKTTNLAVSTINSPYQQGLQQQQQQQQQRQRPPIYPMEQEETTTSCTNEPPLVKLKQKCQKAQQPPLHSAQPRRHTMTSQTTHEEQKQQQLEKEEQEQLRRDQIMARHDTWYFSSNHVLVNRERMMRGLPPLRRNIVLDRLARKAATIMAQSCGDLRQLDNAPHHGNVVRGKSIRSMHQQIMALLSSNERANILNPSFSDFGMGTCKGDDGHLYLCQFFDTVVTMGEF